MPAIPLPIAAPTTPPVLADLITAHTLFVRRKRKEQEEQADLHSWYMREAQAVDKRARKAQHIAWIVASWKADPTVDLN